MTTPLPGASDLRRAMTESLNWREPGATIVPSVPPRRKLLNRAWRWVMTLMRWGRA